MTFKPAGILLVFCIAHASLGQVSFTNLGTFPGYTHSSAEGVNSDGTVVVGTSWQYDQFQNLTAYAYRWTSAGGMQNLGSVSGNSFARGISGDGTAVVGYAGTLSHVRAFRWTTQTGMQLIGGLFSYAWATSHDGSVTAGSASQTFQGAQRASRWNGVTHEFLPFLPGSNQSSAQGIDAAGSVIVGSSFLSGGRATLWTSQETLNLGTLPGQPNSSARAISGDASTVIGTSGSRAFSWTASSGMIDLGSLSSTGNTVPAAVSFDGSRVVGKSDDLCFIWQGGLGITPLHTYLEAAGLDLTGWTLTQANGLSADGTVIVGTGIYQGDTRGWIARIPGPGSTGTLVGFAVLVSRRRRSPSKATL